jgi:hypothetical protein
VDNSSGDESEKGEREEAKWVNWEKQKLEVEILDLLSSDCKEDDVYEEQKRASRRFQEIVEKGGKKAKRMVGEEESASSGHSSRRSTKKGSQRSHRVIS